MTVHPILIEPGTTEVSWSCRECVREKHRGIQPPWATGDDIRLVEKTASVPTGKENGIVYCDHGHGRPLQWDIPARPGS